MQEFEIGQGIFVESLLYRNGNLIITSLSSVTQLEKFTVSSEVLQKCKNVIEPENWKTISSLRVGDAEVAIKGRIIQVRLRYY